jgi:uncharacterized protein YecE (DUF72 family)
MKFGYINYPEKIDFTLPSDHPQNSLVLAGQPDSRFRFYYGTTKFGFKEWIGNFFPAGIKEKDFLKSYASQLNGIELNATHHRIPPAEWILRWKNATGPGFKFSPKIYQVISHRYRLKNCESLIQNFIGSMSLFDEKLGCTFLQLPENFSPSGYPDLIRFIDKLPAGYQLAVEFRHSAWFSECYQAAETFDKFVEKGIALVITDTPGRRDVLHGRLTAPVVMIRFLGNNLDQTDQQRIIIWLERINKWKQQGLREVYFFVHQHQELSVPQTLAYLVKQANKILKLNFHLLKFELENPQLFQH